mmetsp:Transcript_30273/g.79486  ORF Transcript_30273/g.79486 Transcript_30273/m.79486 type:complete len:345 (+) Transcript_30273:54-1088(+)
MMLGLRSAVSSVVTGGAAACVRGCLASAVPHVARALGCTPAQHGVEWGSDSSQIAHPKIRALQESLPERASKKRMDVLRGLLKRQTPRDYLKATAFFEDKVKKGTADVPLYALMLDHTYNVASSREMAKQLLPDEEQWADPLPNVGFAFAAALNTAILHNHHGAQTELRAHAKTLDPHNARLRGLAKRTPERLCEARRVAILKAGKYGCYADGMAIFTAVKRAGLDKQSHHEAALWACASYEEQAAHWSQMDAKRAEAGWGRSPSVDAYNAIIWRLYLEDRPKDIHRVLNEIKRLGLRPNDVTLHAVQRMGERLSQLKRAERDHWIPWQGEFTLEPSPRLRVGL